MRKKKQVSYIAFVPLVMAFILGLVVKTAFDAWREAPSTLGVTTSITQARPNVGRAPVPPPTNNKWEGPFDVKTYWPPKSSGAIQAMDFTVNGSMLNQWAWRGNRLYYRTIPIDRGAPMWKNASGWQINDVTSFPTGGDMQTMASYSIGNTMYQEIWRGDKGWRRSIPMGVVTPSPYITTVPSPYPTPQTTGVQVCGGVGAKCLQGNVPCCSGMACSQYGYCEYRSTPSPIPSYGPTVVPSRYPYATPTTTYGDGPGYPPPPTPLP